MECETVLDLVELVRPGSDDFEASEFEDARQHMDSCESCAAQFSQIQSFDRAAFALAGSNKPEIPVGLADRITNAIATESSIAEPSVAESAPILKSRARRRVLQSVCAAMLLGVVAIIVSMWKSPTTSFTVADLENRVAFDVSGLKPLNLTKDSDNFFAFRVPSSFSGNYRLEVDSRSRGQDLDADNEHDLAVIRFSYGPRGRAPFEGVVAAIPVSRLTGAETLSTSFSQAEVRYSKRGGEMVAVAIWRERDLAYVCIVIKPSDLESIQRHLRTGTA
jgi:hypothetical protein